MLRKMTFAALLTTAVLIGAYAIAEDEKPAGGGAEAPQMPLPPGWTEADMQACMLAATPGDKQKFLHRAIGTWEGKSQMWMFPGSEPMNSTCSVVITDMMDGRYVKVDWSSEMPGMGPFKGFGINGYDNAAGKFVSTWVDSMSTGIMNGTGELSADEKTMTWSFVFTCPVTKKPTPFRQVEKITGEKTKMLEMFSIEPKSGKEYKLMSIELTKK